MTRTVYASQNRSGETLSGYIVGSLRTDKDGMVSGLSKLTPGTCKRLLTDIPSGLLTHEAVDLLGEVGESPQRDGPLESFIAPVVRTARDFHGCGGVALKTIDGWRVFAKPQIDESDNKVVVQADALTVISKDPRDPGVVPFDIWSALHNRKRRGTGAIDRPYDLFKVAVRLSGFSEVPTVADANITGVIRHFTTPYSLYTNLINNMQE